MPSCPHCNKSFAAQKSLSSHRCKESKAYKIAMLQQNKEEIIELFVEKYWSVQDIAGKFGTTHLSIANFLKSNGIEYDRDVILSRRVYAVARSKETFIKKYGVDNPSKNSDIKDKVKTTCINKYGSTNGGWSIDSQVKHFIMGKTPDPNNKEDYDAYVDKVSRLTKINRKSVPYSGWCYYSGAEVNLGKHWNHPFRATLDHKIPVLIGFAQGIPPEQIASINNLVWCCKLLNVYKGSMTEEQFKNSGIIERFMQYESYLRSASK
jgi:hypothetical protein